MFAHSNVVSSLLQGTEPACRYPATHNKYSLFRKATPPAWEVPAACRLSFFHRDCRQIYSIPVHSQLVAFLLISSCVLPPETNLSSEHFMKKSGGKKSLWFLSYIFTGNPNQLKVKFRSRACVCKFGLKLPLSSQNLALMHFQKNTCCQRLG